MNRILGKRLKRELKNNFLRYLALVLLIVMGMYVVVSIVGAADTILAGSAEKAEENRVEDGEFEVFLPLTEEQEKVLADTGIWLEKMFYMDVEAKDGSTVRLMKNRERINLLALDTGRLPENSGEAVSEKRYGEELGLKIGGQIAISGLTLEIVGTASTPDYDLPTQTFSDMSAKSSQFGIVFVTEKQYEEAKKTLSFRAENYCYAYRLADSGKTDADVKQILLGFHLDPAQLKEMYFPEGMTEISALFDEYSGSAQTLLISFVKRADNPRILAAAGDMRINWEAGLLAGVIIMVLFTYVISVFVVHQIQRESSVIGTLYALGAKKKELLLHYITLPFILALAGGVFGALLGFSRIGIPIQMTDSYHYFSLPQLKARHPFYLIVYSVAMPPAVSVIVNYLTINRRLSRTVLSLIRTEPNKKNTRNINFGKMKFIRIFQLRQMMREARTIVTVVCGMMISLLVLMLGLNCYVMCQNVQNDSMNSTKFEYMYSLKYPEQKIPEGGEACYVKSLSKTFLGYSVNLSVIGISPENRYYGTKPAKGKNSLVISRSVRQKYGLRTGDSLILTDHAEDKDYTFTIEGICDYAGGLAVFMDIDSMRELFGQKDDYYNMLLSDRELSIDGNRIYSITTKEDVVRSASVFTALMMPLIRMMTGAAILIFCMVLYLMMGVMIDRASFGISLARVFGYRTAEIRKLYLNGNTWIVAAGSVIGIPAAKIIMDALYPRMVANTACGMNLEFPWYLYAEIFAGVMAVYFAVNAFLVRKLNRITPAEVLKNRE